MTSVRIVSTEPCGNLVAVTIEVESDEIFSIEGKRVDVPDRAGMFHKDLHGSRVTHAHNRRTTRDIVYVEAPFSEDKVADRIAAIQADVERTQPADFACEQDALQERCVVNGGAERSFYRAAKCPGHILGAIEQRFPGFDLASLSLVSTPVYHDVLKQNVISTFLWEDDVPGLTIDGLRLIARSRKFCLESGSKYDRLYTFPDGSESFKFLPPSSRLLAKSVNSRIEGPLRMPDITDIYFAGSDHEVQRRFGLPPRTGSERTYYGATIANGDVVRVKQYLYDAPGIFYDWDGTVKRAAEAHGVELPPGVLK
jgi:hypothetical protein